MDGSVAAALDPWDNFYLIIGGAAAALTGLQFVVMTLIDSARRAGGELSADNESLGAFGTPTVVHFAATLLIAAIGTTPWESLAAIKTALVVVGAAGLVYGIVITWRARRQTSYHPVLEDWIFHTILPIAAYAGIVVAGSILKADPGDGLFVVNGMAMLLLFIGIHNAWDTVTWITTKGIAGIRQDVDSAAAPHRPAPPQPTGRRNRRRR